MSRGKKKLSMFWKVATLIYVVITLVFYISVVKMNLLPNLYLTIFTIGEVILTAIMAIGLTRNYRSKLVNIICLILDESFASDKYDYHNQGWYKQIKQQLTKDNNTAWSLPYYEDQGSETMMITVGSGIYDGDKLIGMSTVDWKIDSIFNEISEMKPLEHGFVFYNKGKKIKDSFSVLASEKDNYIINSKA